MKQTQSNASAETSKSTPIISRKYNKSISGLFVQGENLQIAPTFHPFRMFPPEWRLKVWKTAIMDIPPRVICLQPYSNAGIPGVLQACRESRTEAKKTFTIVKSSQPNLPITHAINYVKDTLYLNRNFKDKEAGKFPTALYAAIHFYKDVMMNAKRLAMNLEDACYLTTAYRDIDGKRDLWKILEESCPKLEDFQLVIDGPAKGRTVKKLRKLHIVKSTNASEFRERHKHLVLVIRSWQRAEKGGCCKGLRKALASIDQTKELPIREGEKGNKDGSGMYDAYGICDYPMKWGRNGEPVKLKLRRRV